MSIWQAKLANVFHLQLLHCSVDASARLHRLRNFAIESFEIAERLDVKELQERV